MGDAGGRVDRPPKRQEEAGLAFYNQVRGEFITFRIWVYQKIG